MTYILTLHLDEAAQTHFNWLRQLYFPPERNLIDAHVTLFHTLPEQPFVTDVLAAAAAAQVPFIVEVTGLRSLGGGVAYTLESSALQALHKTLAASFAEHLSAQDRQRFQPHIVVQNKVPAAVARLLLQELKASFVRSQMQGLGLTLWHYCGGPWELAAHFPFAG